MKKEKKYKVYYQKPIMIKNDVKAKVKMIYEKEEDFDLPGDLYLKLYGEKKEYLFFSQRIKYKVFKRKKQYIKLIVKGFVLIESNDKKGLEMIFHFKKKNKFIYEKLIKVSIKVSKYCKASYDQFSNAVLEINKDSKNYVEERNEKKIHYSKSKNNVFN